MDYTHADKGGIPVHWFRHAHKQIDIILLVLRDEGRYEGCTCDYEARQKSLTRNALNAKYDGRRQKSLTCNALNAKYGGCRFLTPAVVGFLHLLTEAPY